MEEQHLQVVNHTGPEQVVRKLVVARPVDEQLAVVVLRAYAEADLAEMFVRNSLQYSDELCPVFDSEVYNQIKRNQLSG